VISQTPALMPRFALRESAYQDARGAAVRRSRRANSASSTSGCGMHYVTLSVMSMSASAMAERQDSAYLDIPFQHARLRVEGHETPANDEKTLERIRNWRRLVPDLTLRSTFIVGFPGETEEDFAYLLNWLEEARSTAPAPSNMKPSRAPRLMISAPPVPDEVKESRWKRFMERQQRSAPGFSNRKSAAHTGHRRRARRVGLRRAAKAAAKPMRRRRRRRSHFVAQTMRAGDIVSVKSKAPTHMICANAT